MFGTSVHLGNEAEVAGPLLFSVTLLTSRVLYVWIYVRTPPGGDVSPLSSAVTENSLRINQDICSVHYLELQSSNFHQRAGDSVLTDVSSAVL